MPLTVLTMPTPAVLDGAPVSPAYWAKLPSTVTLHQGPSHIHAIKDPDPVWNPRTSGWSTPPPRASKPWSAHWTVRDLPDPSGFPGDFYWLGAPSSADGTSGIRSACRQWAANGSTPHAPSWHSFFPYKPSVRAYDSYLPGGDIVHHPKGVHFNSHFIEHMWADFGRARRQPFSWVIAAMVVSWPAQHYAHHLLDAGRNPDAVGFPRISAAACNTPRTINDGLDYRTVLAVTPDTISLTSRANASGNATVRCRSDAAHRPKMFFGIFDGASSRVGAYDTGAHRLRKGDTSNGPDQLHRYYVLGRKQNHISQDDASHLLVFEIRFWDIALTADDLDGQFDQLSSTYSFDRYRAIR